MRSACKPAVFDEFGPRGTISRARAVQAPDSALRRERDSRGVPSLSPHLSPRGTGFRPPDNSRSSANLAGPAPARPAGAAAASATNRVRHLWAWIALASLVIGLVAAAVLLAPWRLKVSVDAIQLYEQAAEEAESGTLAGWRARATRTKR